MAHPFHHAESSARKYGGTPADYQAIHDWFDASKAHLALPTHRALRHHTAGIFEAERLFGATLTNSALRVIPVRWIGEQHVKEDCGGIIPSVADWLTRITPAPWMGHGQLNADREPLTDDPAKAWRRAVLEGRTILGLHDWMADNTQSPATACAVA